jgi:hypothetical protein
MICRVKETKKEKIKGDRKWYMISPPGSLVIKKKEQTKIDNFILTLLNLINFKFTLQANLKRKKGVRHSRRSS